ncbi:MAG: hypothetical protein ACOCTT_04120 [archaeon]
MYKDPILQKYLDLIKDNRDDIKTYQIGDPFEINLDTTKLPAVFATYDRQELTEETNQTDEHRISITLSVVTDIRSNWQGKGDAIIDSMNKLYEIIAGRNDDYTLEEKSLLYLIRNNVAIDPPLFTDVGSVTVADFGIANRPPEEFAIQSNIEIQAYFSQQR